MNENDNIILETASFIAGQVCSGHFVDNSAGDGNTCTVDIYVIRLNDFALNYWYTGCCREVSRDRYEDSPDGDIQWHNCKVLVSYYKKMFKYHIINNLNIEVKGDVRISQLVSDVFIVMHTYKV